MDQKKIIALLTDFGLDDHFAATMKAVILGIDQEIPIYDITHNIQPQNILELKLCFVKTFSEVEQGEPLAYIDSSGRFGLSVNQGNFAEKYNIGMGTFWTIIVRRTD